MTQTDLWKALEETQLYISKYYAPALTDEDKHDQLKAYIEKFVLDNGYLVDGFTDEELVNRLYSEMVEYSILTPYLGASDIDEINVNAWDDVVLTYSDGRMVKTEELPLAWPCGRYRQASSAPQRHDYRQRHAYCAGTPARQYPYYGDQESRCG